MIRKAKEKLIWREIALEISLLFVLRNNGISTCCWEPLGFWLWY